MKKTIDARGLQCPMPVIETKKALNTMVEETLEVLVDNSIAVQNLVKMATQKELNYTSEKIDNDNYVVTIENVRKEGTTPMESVEEETEICIPDSRQEKVVVVLSADHMGEGDDTLGRTLMKGFIYALTEIDQLPEKILLYNSGAKLSSQGSDSLEDLKLLESQGVEIITCGTCLDFYNLTEKLGVGTVTNMYSIVEILSAATKIIKP